jgi:2,3-dihydroxybenzoate decarboxylase
MGETMISKIALEEHFVPAELTDLITNPGWGPPAWQRTVDLLTDTERRLAKMDEAGVEIAVLSLGSNGIQDVLGPGRAVALATAVNDALAEVLAAQPDRYLGLAALPMLGVDAAVAELDRCVRTLGFKGALVNGYSSDGNLEHGRYYDDPSYDPLWERFAALDVPFYLHPRNPLPDQRRI